MMAATAAATTSEDANPYGVISEKNVFRLNPPPPAAPAEVAKPPDIPKVMLSGFQKVGDRMKVYLAIPAKDAKDTTAYLALQAGEKERDVEVIKIREDKQEVDILNTGTLMTLTIKSNGFALTGGGAAPGKPGPAGGPPGPGGRRLNIPAGGPQPMRPTAGAPPPANADNAAIVAGGNGFNSGSPSYNGSTSSYGTSGAIVSGGMVQPEPGVGAVPNSAAAQIANSLLSGANSGQGYRMPVPENVVPASPVVQAAGLLIHQAAGGPPSPTGLEGPAEGGGPPGPEQ
jgi:hypothetical protein